MTAPTYQEQVARVTAAGDRLTAEFGDRFRHVNRPGSLFRLDRAGSFWSSSSNDEQLCLQVQRYPGGPWLDFTRGPLAGWRPYLRARRFGGEG